MCLQHHDGPHAAGPHSLPMVLRCCFMQACGSGGTTAGLALGNHLSGMGATVHAYGVCDDEEYFYDFIDGLFKLLGATPDKIGMLAGPPRPPSRACQAAALLPGRNVYS